MFLLVFSFYFVCVCYMLVLFFVCCVVELC